MDDFTSNVYVFDEDIITCLNQIENNLNSLKSSFSGTSSPTPDIATTNRMMFWGDETNYMLRFFHTNASTGAEDWPGIMFGDETYKIWVFRNDAMDGWVVSDTETDCLLSIEGGSVYTTRGNIQGSWAIADSHNHQWFKSTSSGNDEKLYDSDGNEVSMDWEVLSNADGLLVSITYVLDTLYEVPCYQIDNDCYTSKDQGSGTTEWRPEALVGTMQYINT